METIEVSERNKCKKKQNKKRAGKMAEQVWSPEPKKSRERTNSHRLLNILNKY